MFAITKINNKNAISSLYLYKTHTGRYIFNNKTNLKFNSEDEATNFIFYNSDNIKHFMDEGDKLFVVPYNQ